MISHRARKQVLLKTFQSWSVIYNLEGATVFLLDNGAVTRTDHIALERGSVLIPL